MIKRISMGFGLLVLAFLANLFGSAAAQPPDLEKLREKPIATGGGKVGELLRQWWKEGTAAGNAGDFYDNRDGDHSPLNLSPYPQLSAIKYTAEDVKLQKHWAGKGTIEPHVTFGNSSTSAPAHLGGSNPRSYYVFPKGLAFLHKQYISNNIYIYPEHRDHDPGHNGKGDGYGDLYPTNTPYLMISQGSSGSDQPFMRMLPVVLASFRPEVKKKLTETGLLMPTIQMLWRSTNKHLKDPQEYLTGKAHPTVFEGSWVDDLAMVQKAHALELKALPPMVQLRAVEEDKATNGVDFIDLANSEVLADTPACIARIHRSKAHTRRLVVSAESSFDVNKGKLTYTWVVLRGDSEKIKIVPKKDDQSVAEITVAWHDRRPVSPGSPLESNRVDIGVFVHNGTYYSAPGFVTVCTLDREARTYSQSGKILDIAHGMGETEIRGINWTKLFWHVGNKESPVAQLLAMENKAAFRELLDDGPFFMNSFRPSSNRLKCEWPLLMQLKAAKEAADQKESAKKELDLGRQAVTKGEKAINTALDAKEKALDDSPRHFLESRLSKLARDPLFTQTHADWLKERRTAANEPRIKALWQKLVRFGIANDKEILTPLLPGKTLAEAKWTKFERAQLEAFHASLLAELAFPGMLQVEYRGNYVDQRLSVPREWRDVYRYDAKGEAIGWTRYSAAGVQTFNHEGLLVVEKDAQGRCVKARTVRYVLDPPKTKGINTNHLRMTPGDMIVRYEFDGETDLRGRRAGTEAVKDEKMPMSDDDDLRARTPKPKASGTPPWQPSNRSDSCARRLPTLPRNCAPPRASWCWAAARRARRWRRRWNASLPINSIASKASSTFLPTLSSRYEKSA